MTSQHDTMVGFPRSTVEQPPTAPVLPAAAEGFSVAGTAGEGARSSPSPAPQPRHYRRAAIIDTGIYYVGAA